MKCNCQNWDDTKPCPKHKPKMPQPEIAEHQIMVVRLYRRKNNLKWFYTIGVDGITTSISDQFEQRPKIKVTVE